MRTVKPHVSFNTLTIIHYSYFHSIMNYGLLFWGSSTDSIKIFKLQKRIIRIMMGCRRKQSCRELFVKFIHPAMYRNLLFLIIVIYHHHKNI